MSANNFLSAQGRPIEATGRPEEANSSSSASRAQLPHPGEPNGAVVRVTAADVLPSANLQPPTAQTFEELGIPAAYREAVEKELTRDEKMLWVGRASRNPEVQARKPILRWIGTGLLVLAAVVLVVILGSAVAAMKLESGQVIGCCFAVLLGLFGALFLLPWIFNTANSCRGCYVVTNRRALLVEVSMWKRGAAAQSYLPQQLLGLDRRDHPTVAGAGDLVFEYEFMLQGSGFNVKTGTMLQETANPSGDPQRIARGFLGLDKVREVEDLIRTTLLSQFEQAPDAATPTVTTGDALRRSDPAIAVPCPCGVTLAAPAGLAGKSVKCPRCAAAVALPAPAPDPVSYREDGSVPADIKDRLLKELDAKEKPVWVGAPVPKLVLLRKSAYFAVGGVGILAALIWWGFLLMPAKAPAAPPQVGKQAGKQVVTAPESPSSSIFLLLPLGVFVASACFAAVPVLNWRTATRTCYVLTNRRALVYKDSPFGATRESYTPLEVSNMRRSNSWLASDSGDLIFRTVYVISTSRSQSGRSNSSVRTVHYGFLAIANIGEVDKLVRETLIDRFVDRLARANAML